MPVNYTIQADVIDIRTDVPKDTDAFLVDSNVWFWMTYTRASQGRRQPRSYQINAYPSYVNSALANGAKIYWSGLSLAELSHQIEKNERELYGAQQAQSIGAKTAIFKTKEYRHNFPVERANAPLEVRAAWGQVRTMADPLDVTIDEQTTDAAVNRYQSEAVDGYDLFFLEAMVEHSVVQIITDDGDFSTVPGICVFTANRSVIDAANAQGHLVVR